MGKTAKNKRGNKKKSMVVEKHAVDLKQNPDQNSIEYD